MAKATRGSERREGALSRERIVGAAIALLDDEGEPGLTFRALATRLATGPGAIYWHIANKSELLLAASDAVVARAMGEVPASATPHEAIRRINFEADLMSGPHHTLGRAVFQAYILDLQQGFSGRLIDLLRNRICASRVALQNSH